MGVKVLTLGTLPTLRGGEGSTSVSMSNFVKGGEAPKFSRRPSAAGDTQCHVQNVMSCYSLWYT